MSPQSPKLTRFLRKWTLLRYFWFWAALPGAQHLERCFAPKDKLHMTRRAFLALRAIRRQGELDFQWSFERIWLGVSFWNVFRRFLVIYEFVLSGVSKINYFRSRRVRWSIREVQDISFSGPIFVLKCRLNLQNWQDFWKSERSWDISGFGRPCRGVSTWKGAFPKELWFYMTRRAFLALRVMRRQGGFDSNMRVKKVRS